MSFNCLFKENCKVKPCDENCIKWLEFDYLVSNSNIPKKKINPNNLILIPEDCDLDSFYALRDIQENIIDFVEKGSNLYLYSLNSGNGKTTWSIKLLMRYFNRVWIGNGFRKRGLFIHVPTFMNELRNNISRPSEDFMKLKDLLLTVDLVVWDDIGAVNIKEYDHLTLLSYLDQRIVNEKSNIFTGNLKEGRLESVVGQRLYSRIWKNSLKIELCGLDRRGLNGNTANSK